MIFEDKFWQVHHLEVGELMVNCYVVVWRETKEAIIIDPGAEGWRILEFVSSESLTITGVVNTHGHGDHIGANREVLEAIPVPLMIGKFDREMLTNAQTNMSAPFGMGVTSPDSELTLEEGDTVKVGNGELKVFHAPGHSPGSIILVAEHFAIVGDVLFAGSIGRTDFPGGSLTMLLDNIRSKIFTLPGEVLVLPGHGPDTTVAEEKATNPFLRPDFNPSAW